MRTDEGEIVREDVVGVVLEPIRRALQGLRFGTVTIVVHDGAVVQVERTEKIRLSRTAATG